MTSTTSGRTARGFWSRLRGWLGRTEPPSEGASAGGVDDPKEFVLNRELSEVHLMLDSLSANPEKTFDLMDVGEDGGLDRT